MHNEILVTIITVCYNSEKYIEEAIKSILNQTYPFIEYIVVDGNSKDNTLKIIKQYENAFNNRMKWISEEDKGIYDAFNKGIAMAHGQIIGITNSDDFLEPLAVESVVALYREQCNKNLILHGNMRIVDEKGQYLKTWCSNNIINNSTCTSFMPVCHPSTFVTCDVYRKIGVFNLEYKIASDYDFIMRCINANVEFIKVDKVLTNFRNIGVSSRKSYNTIKESVNIKIKYGDNNIHAFYIGIRGYILGKILDVLLKFKCTKKIYQYYKTKRCS